MFTKKSAFLEKLSSFFLSKKSITYTTIKLVAFVDIFNFIVANNKNSKLYTARPNLVDTLARNCILGPPR